MSRALLGSAVLVFLIACGAPLRPAPPVGVVQAPPVASAPAVDELDKPLPLDGRVKLGRLENGLTYYILAHQKPEKRAQVWLAVNAGSVLEDDDQRGLAHLVEHLAFNGTRRFPKHALTDFMERSGVRSGADLNAYTSFDETVYMLQVPTDKSEFLKQSVSVLRDWADGVSFDAEEVEKERPVVLEEWRMGRGAPMRLFDKQAPVLFHGSKYAERIVIGKPEIIRNASRDTIVRYYRDWYRPDLMAVVMVGDFVPSEVEGMIREEFGSLKAPSQARARPQVGVPAHAEPLVSVESDAEMPVASVSVVSKLPHRPESSAREYRRKLAEQIFSAMLNERFDELRRRADAPFLSAGAASTALTRSADQFRLSANIKEDGAIPATSALLEELLRVERHGFGASELERAKSRMLRRFQQTVKERDKLEGRVLAAEIVRNFLQQEPMPGPEAELALLEKFLPTFTLAELNQVGKTLAAGSRVILVSGPASMQKPSSEVLLALNREISARQVEAHADATSNVQLMPTPPRAGSITKTKELPELSVTEWTLSNGVKVVLKPTNFANDDVRFAAHSPGGISLVKDADFPSARFADDIAREGGVGPFDAFALRKALAGKVVSVSPGLGELDERISGGGSSADLELTFQLIHLWMTAPRRDEPAFTTWRARELERAKHRVLMPESYFHEQVQLLNTQNHLRRRPVTPELLDRVNLDKALNIYKERFADASDFTFVFVGNFTLEQIKPLAETYLASLPTRARKETWRDVGVRWPNGVQKKTFTKGSEPKSIVTLTFHGEKAWSREAENDLRALREVLRLGLRDVLREDMGGVYGVQVTSGFSRRPRPEYTFGVNFQCQPENVEKLEKAVFDAIQALRDNGTTDDYLQRIKEGRRRAHETDLKDNGYWLRELGRAYLYGDDPRLILDIESLIANVTSERVRAAAKQYLSKQNYVLAELRPEQAPAAAP
ncbi:MAG: M16 family metallopeptidase [Myxococcota bacterium]